MSSYEPWKEFREWIEGHHETWPDDLFSPAEIIEKMKEIEDDPRNSCPGDHAPVDLTL